MNEGTIVINPREVLVYAGDSPNVLNSLVGQKLKHVIYGVGGIESIAHQRYINVIFLQSTNEILERTFIKAAFYDGKLTASGSICPQCLNAGWPGRNCFENHLSCGENLSGVMSYEKISSCLVDGRSDFWLCRIANPKY